MRLLAGFDLGTTGCRCVIFNEKLDLLGEDYQEYPLFTEAYGIVEQDAEQWWSLLVSTLSGAAANAGRRIDDIATLSISSQGITVVPVNSKIEPLARAINWLDRRADTGFESITQSLGKDLYADITARISPEPYGLSKIMWFLRHRPEIASKTAFYLMPMDFITAKLCGNVITDHSMAAGLGCYDIKNRIWSEDILKTAGVPMDRLPMIVQSGTIAGHVTKKASKITGLRPGIIVAVGAQDQKCGALGAGIDRSTVTVSLGTCMAMLAKSDRILCKSDVYLPSFSDLFQDGYLLEGCVTIGAGCLKWFRDLFCPGYSYDQLTGLASQYIPTMEGPLFFPYLSGMGTPKHWENGTGCFYGLRLNTSLQSISHSILESIGFTLRQNLEAAYSITNFPPTNLRLFGGGAKSNEWLQIIADITGLPVESLYTHEVSCVGAAMLSGMAAGIFKDVKDAQNAGVRVKERLMPNQLLSDIYNQRYQMFKRYENLMFSEQPDLK